MINLPKGWRIFKGIGILQMIMVIFLLVISITGVFYDTNRGWRFLEAGCYTLMLLFLYQGFSVLNDNYPDTPLSQKQKRKFNLLFLSNFLLISFTFAKFIVQWRYAYTMLEIGGLSSRSMTFILVPLIIAFLVFAFNIVYLGGMYRLRRTINENDRKKIENEFISGN